MANEVRLIDMNTMWQCETCFHHGTNGCKTWCDAGESYRPAASKFKIIDPETLRPKGRWVSNWYKITCSLCNHSVFLGTKDPVCHKAEKENFKFCRNCGAKMEG